MYSVVLAMALMGGAEAPDCHCGHGGRGGCYGGGCYGGGYGGCYGGGYGCGGTYGGMGYGGAYYGGMGGYYGSLSPYGVIVADAAAPATIIVNLPADAKLKVDGSLVSQQTTPQRYLQTPPIQPGQQFTYTLVAETTREGRPVSQTQTITVQPGQQLLVNFALSTTPVTSSR